MIDAIADPELDNWHDYEISSPREIASLLRQIGEKNQPVRLLLQGGQDVCVTSLLDMDAATSTMLLDCAIDRAQNLRILASRRLRFETTLDKVRIVFIAEQVESAIYEDLPALRCAIPATLIRLQRREFYRMETPLASPLRVTVPLLKEGGGIGEAFTLSDISMGGLALLDNKLLLGFGVGHKLTGCTLALPDGALGATLVVRNANELTLLNGKRCRRVGCAFLDLPRGSLASVQRYITRLERERNARQAGLE